jgi:glycosyltransferase involved in cell wall biosynthesis
MSYEPVKFGIVAIGRNEGERLKDCLRSLPVSSTIVYVDSGSTDGSQAWAREFGAEVLSLDLSTRFTAARARNAGFRRLLELVPQILYIQFIDGDCGMHDEWPYKAIAFLQEHAEVAAAFGRRRERHPSRSVYNQLCDWEWDGPLGEARACGGDVMIRTAAFQTVGGYRDSLIAGEEPELCVRLRAAGWHIWRLNEEMTLHDAAITRFGQWWKRTQRTGYAFAEGADLHGAPPERHWVWESRRAWIWGVGLPIVCMSTSLIFMPWGWASWGIYPLQMIRLTLRDSGRLRNRAIKSFFQVLGRLPEGWGQIQFIHDHLQNRNAQLIEYK